MQTEIQAARPIQDFAQNPVIQLRQDLRIMKDYLMMCAGKEDWHGVMDAAVDKALKDAPEQAHRHLHRIKIDTYIGMAFSNLAAFAIMVTAAATLHRHGVTDIQTSAQAAEALRPVAGAAAFFLFALGIVGTGMLAVPVLAAASAYYAAEAFGWKVGLGKSLLRAKGFYSVLGVGMVLGIGLNFTALDPIKALVGSAIINGIVAVPVMAVLVYLSSKRKVMGGCVNSFKLKVMGWIATRSMATVVVAMLVTSVS